MPFLSRTTFMNKEFLSYLMTLVSDTKQTKMREILNYRTTHITIILEDLFQEHNISASFRSAEIFGIQNVHIIEQKNPYRINPNITRGASEWLTIHHHANTVDAFQTLRTQGYTIVATVPGTHQHSIPLEKLSLDSKIALIFGSEHGGLSQDALNNADVFVTIPMFGFTQSLNVSACAALCLYTLVTQLHKSTIGWGLTSAGKEELFFEWMCKSVRHFKHHKEHFFNQRKND